MSLEIACMFVALLFCTSLRSQISLFCSILAVALYMHFATSVIHEITNALGIHCFRFVHQFITTIFFSTCFHQSVSWNKFCLVTGSLGKRHNSHPRASVLPWTVIYHKWCLPDKKISYLSPLHLPLWGWWSLKFTWAWRTCRQTNEKTMHLHFLNIY